MVSLAVIELLLPAGVVRFFVLRKLCVTIFALDSHTMTDLSPMSVQLLQGARGTAVSARVDPRFAALKMVFVLFVGVQLSAVALELPFR